MAFFDEFLHQRFASKLQLEPENRFPNLISLKYSRPMPAWKTLYPYFNSDQIPMGWDYLSTPKRLDRLILRVYDISDNG